MSRKKYDTSYFQLRQTIQEQIKRKKVSPHGKEKFRTLKALCTISIKQKIVLDAGCGEGFMSAQAALEGANVIMMDISREALELAIQNAHTFNTGDKVNAIVADVQNLPLINNAIDVIVLSDMLEHVSNPAAALIEANRALSKGQGLFLVVPNAFGFYEMTVDLIDKGISKIRRRLPNHIHRFTRAKISYLLQKCGFEVVHHRSFEIKQLVIFKKVICFPRILHWCLKPWRVVFCDELVLWARKK